MARTGYRRTRLTALGGAVVLVLTFLATGEGRAATPQAAVEPGQGSAFAGTLKIDPRAGNLSIGIDEGKSTATHQNTAAQAVSQAIDLGTIGTSLAAYGCDGSDPTLAPNKQPQPLIADTRDPNAPQQASADETNLVPGPGLHKSVEVTPAPFAKAVTTTAPVGVDKVATFGGGTSQATSGMVDGVRVAEALADISGIDIAGAVKLSGLHWQARSSSEGDPTGSFTIGAASIGGNAIPTQDPAKTLAQLNAVLDPIGLHLTAPTQHVDSGVLFVDPLVLSVVPNAGRDAVAGALIKGIQPVRGPLFDALLTAYCKSNTEITVADIAIGSVTGAGSFNLLFGGAQATTGTIDTNGFILGFGGGLLGGAVSLPAPSLAPTTGGSSATAARPAVAAAPAAPSTGSTTTNGTAAKAAPAAVEAIKGKRGGALAGVGLGSLALLALMAEGDRRKMRRAQREIPVFS